MRRVQIPTRLLTVLFLLALIATGQVFSQVVPPFTRCPEAPRENDVKYWNQEDNASEEWFFEGKVTSGSESHRRQFPRLWISFKGGIPENTELFSRAVIMVNNKVRWVHSGVRGTSRTSFVTGSKSIDEDTLNVFLPSTVLKKIASGKTAELRMSSVRKKFTRNEITCIARFVNVMSRQISGDFVNIPK